MLKTTSFTELQGSDASNVSFMLQTAVVPIGSCSCNLTEMMITANVTTLVGPSGPKGDEGRPGPPGDRVSG